MKINEINELFEKYLNERFHCTFAFEDEGIIKWSVEGIGYSLITKFEGEKKDFNEGDVIETLEEDFVENGFAEHIFNCDSEDDLKTILVKNFKFDKEKLEGSWDFIVKYHSEENPKKVVLANFYPVRVLDRLTKKPLKDFHLCVRQQDTPWGKAGGLYAPAANEPTFDDLGFKHWNSIEDFQKDYETICKEHGKEVTVEVDRTPQNPN